MRLYNSILKLLFVPLCFILQSCGGEDQENKNDSRTPITNIPKVSIPNFNPDSAYNYIQEQLNFGFRTPGSIGQKKCADWMQQKLKTFCDTVYRQSTQVKGGDGKMLPCINLIGSINPKATKRILLLTHWDSRSWADEDDSAQTKPILAADDAASGVGVLIELARQVHTLKIGADIGIDILFTDVEDYGKTEWGEDSYCLGTQYWAHNPHVAGYTAEFGVLLDMVGAKGATFPLEMLSSQYAPDVQRNVYQAAQRAGFSSYFPFVQGGGITDDHKYVNEIIKIPTIDIINLVPNSQEPFKPHWHTHDDNMNVIDRATLKAVGQTLLQIIYETSPQQNNPA
ncbi:MAG: M28 family peptidase [Phycisphaerales bacterium]|nr:M28 family peptidase [Phycisphaerales bacterium]